MFSLIVYFIFLITINYSFDFYYVKLELVSIDINVAAAVPVIPSYPLYPTSSKKTSRGGERIRSYMPKEEKIRVSNNIPDKFNQVVCGLMLSDATIRMNGSQALMGIQQTHQELTQEIWKMCFQLNLVLSEILIIKRTNKKLVYSFQTLSLPYFTSLYNDWYVIINKKRFKVLPLNLDSLFTPLAFAFLIMGDGA